MEAERKELDRVEAERVQAKRVEAERLVEAKRLEAERLEAEQVQATPWTDTGVNAFYAATPWTEEERRRFNDAKHVEAKRLEAKRLGLEAKRVKAEREEVSSRGRAPMTCKVCRDKGHTGEGHTCASSKCPYATEADRAAAPPPPPQRPAEADRVAAATPAAPTDATHVRPPVLTSTERSRRHRLRAAEAKGAKPVKRKASQGAPAKAESAGQS